MNSLFDRLKTFVGLKYLRKSRGAWNQVETMEVSPESSRILARMEDRLSQGATGLEVVHVSVRRCSEVP